MGVALATVIAFSYAHHKTKVLMEKHRENQQFIDEMAQAFAKVIDLKDKYTNGHSFRVAKYSRMLARRMGYKEEEIKSIYNIALLHDVGKTAIPDEILNKASGLTDEEFEIMKSHAQNGYEILKDITIAPDLSLGAGYHHERLDGKGYPRGLKGDEIPMIAQLIAVADTFDAMYSTRPYRKQVPIEEVADELRRIAGTQLNPDVVKVMLQLIDEDAFADAKEVDDASDDEKDSDTVTDDEKDSDTVTGDETESDAVTDNGAQG